jgi:hypothetical protein
VRQDRVKKELVQTMEEVVEEDEGEDDGGGGERGEGEERQNSTSREEKKIRRGRRRNGQGISKKGVKDMKNERKFSRNFINFVSRSTLLLSVIVIVR